MQIARLTILLFVLAQTLGCAEQPKKPPDLEHGALSFLQDGQVTLEEAVLRLGVPTDHFEQDRILTYRVAASPTGGVQLMSRDFRGETGTTVWQHGQFSLVLVFNDRQVLVRHSLVPLHAMEGW